LKGPEPNAPARRLGEFGNTQVVTARVALIFR
jgi:hypothetical protein